MLSQKEKEQGEEGEREVLAEERVPTPVKKWKDTEQKEEQKRGQARKKREDQRIKVKQGRGV
jgi:hypothetical protein